jgi:hypothetical protein
MYYTMTQRPHIPVGSSRNIYISNFLTDASVEAVRAIGHRGHRTSARYVTLCGVTCSHAEREGGTTWAGSQCRETHKNAAMIRKVKRSLVTRVRMCMQADGGQFEQLT